MIHATSYSDGSGFIELVNCIDDNGKPVIYANDFAYVANMEQAAHELQTVYNAGIVWAFPLLEIQS